MWKFNTLEFETSAEVTKCAFRCLTSSPQHSKYEISKSNSWKITSFLKKLRYFRGSRFSHCFVLSTSPHYSLPIRFHANNYFESLPKGDQKKISLNANRYQILQWETLDYLPITKRGRSSPGNVNNLGIGKDMSDDHWHSLAQGSRIIRSEKTPL